MTSSDASVPGTQSVRRALALLAAFDDRHPEWRTAELARELELNRTTAYRLLSALEHAGFLKQDPETDAFRLGPEAIALGARAARQSDLRTAARPELESLADEVTETATLEVLVGGETLILDEAPGPAVLGPSMEIGTRWPAHATSSGKALLAWAVGEVDGPAGDPLDALPEPLPRYTERTPGTREELRAELARIRETGFAIVRGELEESCVAAAAPVRDGSGKVVASVSVAGPGSRLAPERLEAVARRVREAGRRISGRLGAAERAGEEPLAGTAAEGR